MCCFKLFPYGVLGIKSDVFVPNVRMCVKQKKNKLIKHFLHRIYFKKVKLGQSVVKKLKTNPAAVEHNKN